MRRRARIGRQFVGVGAAGLLLLAGCSQASSDGPGTSQAQQSPTEQPAQVTLSLDPAANASDVEPGEPATVTAEDGTITEVRLVGKDGTVVDGELAEDDTSWTAGEKLGFGKSYTLTATGVDAAGKNKTVSSTFSTVEPSGTVGVRTNFAEGQTVGVGMPLIFTFTRPVADRDAAEDALHVEAEPDTEGAFRWFGDKRVVWRPEEYWASGTTVTVDANIYGQDLGDGMFGDQDEKFQLEVGDKVVAEADGRTHQMNVKVNGSTVRTYDTSMGEPAHPTPHGIYTVMQDRTNYEMNSSTFGVPADSPQGYKVTVDYATRLSWSGIFFHSAPWSVGDQGVRNVSHGCLNLATANAQWLMNRTKPGDLVKVTGSGGPPLQPSDGWSYWQMSWAEWTEVTAE